MLSRLGHWRIDRLRLLHRNWRRPPQEVTFLLGLFEHLLHRELAKLCQEQVRVKFVGNLSLLPRSLQTAMQRSILATAP